MNIQHTQNNTHITSRHDLYHLFKDINLRIPDGVPFVATINQHGEVTDLQPGDTAGAGQVVVEWVSAELSLRRSQANLVKLLLGKSVTGFRINGNNRLILDLGDTQIRFGGFCYQGVGVLTIHENGVLLYEGHEDLTSADP